MCFVCGGCSETLDGTVAAACPARRRADAWPYYASLALNPVAPSFLPHNNSTGPLPTKPQPSAGLPEHVSHTKQALALGYSVLAMDPTDARHQCWSSSNSRRGFINDQPHVRTSAAAVLAAGLGCHPGAAWMRGRWLCTRLGPHSEPHHPSRPLAAASPCR